MLTIEYKRKLLGYIRPSKICEMVVQTSHLSIPVSYFGVPKPRDTAPDCSVYGLVIFDRHAISSVSVCKPSTISNKGNLPAEVSQTFDPYIFEG